MAAFVSLLAVAQSTSPPAPGPVRTLSPPPALLLPPVPPSADPAPSPPSPPATPPPSTCIELMPGLQCIESWVIYLASSVIGAVLIIVVLFVVVVKSREYFGRHSRSSESGAPPPGCLGRQSGDGPLGAALGRFAARRQGADADASRSGAKRAGGTGRRGEGSRAALPHGWAKLCAADGSVYFYNHLTKQTSWWPPPADIRPPPPTTAERRAAQAAAAARDGVVTSPSNRRHALSLSPSYISPRRGSCGGDSLRSLAPDWDELVDPDGALFYRHKTSGAVAWSRPVNSDRFSSTSQLVCDHV
jgi:hypothetical protein